MKKRLIGAIILATALLLTSCKTDMLPQALAAETTNTVQQVKIESADVFTEIQHNIDLVAELKEKAQQAQIDGKPVSLSSITNDIERIANSYEALASQKESIKKQLLQKITKMENMRTTVDAEIRILKDRRIDYTKQLRLVSDPNPEIYRTRQKALSQAIDYVDQQIGLWTRFNEIEDGIIIEMSDIQKSIDSFLSMIESSAILFRESWHLLVLARDITNALSLFTEDLPHIQQLTQDMEKSWSTLDALVMNLASISTLGIP